MQDLEKLGKEFFRGDKGRALEAVAGSPEARRLEQQLDPAAVEKAARSGDAEQLKALLTASDLPLYGAALRSDTVDARGVDYSRSAIAIGSEGKGLSTAMLEACHQTVLIPMSDHCESLNAAIAATVLLWEAARND